MPQRPAFLKNSVIIGAHPDDELLWFNAILKDVDQVFIVFKDFWAQPQIGAQRAAAIAAYPRPNVTCLNLSEAGAYGCADWINPVETPHGLSLTSGARVRELKRMTKKALRPIANLPTAAEGVMALYDANYTLLHDALKTRLSPDMNVFTHNPWGEYGHEEHVQVCRVLQVLRREIGFTLWMSNYCTNRSLPLAMRYFRAAPGPCIRLPTNKAFADEVAAVFKAHGCWTWADDWAWFDDECYMEMPDGSSDPAPHRHLMPLNLFTIEARHPRNWVPLAMGVSAATAAAAVAALDF